MARGGLALAKVVVPPSPDFRFIEIVDDSEQQFLRGLRDGGTALIEPVIAWMASQNPPDHFPKGQWVR